jgi:micrococcal nuclease
VFRLLSVLLILATLPAAAEPITGPIGKVRDGDTFLIGRQPIRLCGIEAPPRGEPVGRAATAYLRQITMGQTLRCVPVGEGTPCDGRSKRFSYDRVVAQCFLRNRDIAEMLVRSGHACDWPRYSGGHYRVIGGCTKK